MAGMAQELCLEKNGLLAMVATTHGFNFEQKRQLFALPMTTNEHWDLTN